MSFGKRGSERVEFAESISVRIIGIDGTWTRSCIMVDASETGARLTVKGCLAGIDIKEFFLLLSSRGLAYRRCRLVHFTGDQIGVEYVRSTERCSRYGAQKASGQQLQRLGSHDFHAPVRRGL